MGTANRWRKSLAATLFGLTIIFFVVSYFGLTTSGEDIFQGAHTTPAVIADAKAAFSYNARLPDMYAWAVINFFDYQYRFGVDTIFRLIDVALGVGILYLMVYIVLRRKIELKLKDAVLWALGFLLIFLTPHGRALYAGFSLVHNYLLIMVITLGFALPYVQLAQGEKVQAKWLVMLCVGIVFGLSSNLTPVAFLIVWAGTVGWRKPKNVQRWEFFGVVGVLIGMVIAYLGGPGVTGYINSDYALRYDYVNFGEIIAEPMQSAVRLAKHEVKNLARVMGPIVIICAVMAVARILQWRILQRKGQLAWLPKGKGAQRMATILAVFVAIHVTIAVQLTAPLQILLPAYAAAVIAVMILTKAWFIDNKAKYTAAKQGRNINELVNGLQVGAVTLLMIGVVGARTLLLAEYHAQASKVLERIQASEAEIVCVTRAEVASRALPFVGLEQAAMLVDWAMPAKIYDKTVSWCEEP